MEAATREEAKALVGKMGFMAALLIHDTGQAEPATLIASWARKLSEIITTEDGARILREACETGGAAPGPVLHRAITLGEGTRDWQIWALCRMETAGEARDATPGDLFRLAFAIAWQAIKETRLGRWIANRRAV